MYLNVTSATPTSTDGNGGSSSDPCCTTPEIISSLMSLTGPPGMTAAATTSEDGGENSNSETASQTTPPSGREEELPRELPSIQETRTRLIKEGLKVTLQNKKAANGQSQQQQQHQQQQHQQQQQHYLAADYDSTRDSSPSYSDDFHYGFSELTPEDEERRKKRRERNKVAATKCRNKKKEKTAHLVLESESLESTNTWLKHEIQRLEVEKQRLVSMLTYHMPACSLQNPLAYYADNPASIGTAGL